MFEELQLPKVKRVWPIASELISVEPISELPQGYYKEGNKVYRPDGSVAVTYTTEPYKVKPGTFGHAMLKGYFVYDENSEEVYRSEQPELFKELIEKYKESSPNN